MLDLIKLVCFLQYQQALLADDPWLTKRKGANAVFLSEAFLLWRSLSPGLTGGLVPLPEFPSTNVLICPCPHSYLKRHQAVD